MPAALPYLNNNSGRSFPLIEDSDLTGVYGSEEMELPPSVLLDIHLVVYTQGREPLTLKQIVVNGSGTALTAHFDYNGTALTVPVSAASEWPYRAEVRTSDVHDNTQILFRPIFGKGVADIAAAFAGETIVFTDLEVESSRITVQNKHRVTGVIGALPGSTRLTGDVVIEDGYNIQSSLVPDQRILRLNAIVGAGLGQPCSTLLPEPTNCDDLIYYINGLHPNWYGDFRLVAGPGISIEGDAANNKILIHTSVDHCRPRCKDEAEV